METHVVLLSKIEEPFLKTELELLPDGFIVDHWSSFKAGTSGENLSVRSEIVLHLLDSNYTVAEKIWAALRSFGALFSTGEINAAFQKHNGLRNLVKAFKFGMVSELQVVKIECELKKEIPLIFYSYWMYDVAYIAAKLKNRCPGAKFVTRCHGFDLYNERHINGYIPYRKFILDHADLICPISENGKQYLHDCFLGKYDNRIVVMRLGTIRKVEIPEEQEKEDSIVIVSCSNLVDVKRVHLIINALRKCQKKITWYHFGDGNLRADLEKQAETLGGNVRYKFMGYQANEDVQRFYAEHYIDAFVNVSQSEGIPVSIMEAESYGIPIIATDVGGTSEIVHNGENGVLLSVDFTDEDLLLAIDEVIEKANQYRVEALHTWETMSDAHVVFPEFYKRLAEVM